MRVVLEKGVREWVCDGRDRECFSWKMIRGNDRVGWRGGFFVDIYLEDFALLG